LKTTPTALNTRLVWLLCSLLVAGALVLGYQALTNIDQASVIIEWTTATELNTVGFILLRSEQPTGPFEQINPELIPASDNPYSGGEYSFEDFNTRRGQTYYYMLQDLESNGQINEHGPIVIEASNNSPILLLLAGLMLVSAGILGWQIWSGRKQAPALQKPEGIE
jgi:hypothetical protein